MEIFLLPKRKPKTYFPLLDFNDNKQKDTITKVKSKKKIS